MKRYAEIDILKGIAVICMVVFHLFYYPNKYGYKEIKHTTFPLPLIAKIAQFILGLYDCRSREMQQKRV